MLYKLYDHQLEDENKIREILQEGYRAPLLVKPTGSGKTVIFTSIAAKTASNGYRILIVVHRGFLWQQVSDKLTAAGVAHGIIAPGHTQTRDLIQVASVDTLIRRLHRVPVPDLIIFDEAHHVIPANKWGKVANYFSDAIILGVTATPCRTSGQGLGIKAGGFYDYLHVGAQILDLTPKYLAPYKLFAPEIDLDLTGVRRLAGDYNKTELLKRLDKKRIYGSIPDHYRRICYGVPAIAFCVSVRETERVAEELNAAGISAAAVSGKTSEDRRKYLFNGLADGKFLVLCSCDLVSEGFDVPVCGCAIGLRPTQSLSLCLQQWGRAGRPAPGKQFAYILDHVGNYLRHGMPDAHRDWSLDGVASGDKSNSESEIAIRKCPKCFNIHPPAPVCPECGHVYTTVYRSPQQVEAELQEIKTAREEEIKAEKFEKKKEVWAADSLEALLEIAKERGYKPGWAHHRWQFQKKKRPAAVNIPINLKYEEV